MDFSLNDVDPAGAIAVSSVLVAANLAACLTPSRTPDGAKGVPWYAMLLPLALALIALAGVALVIRGIDGTVEGTRTARGQLVNALGIIDLCINQTSSALLPVKDAARDLTHAADEVSLAIKGIADDAEPALSDVRRYASNYMYAVVGGTCGLWAMYGGIAVLVSHRLLMKVLRVPATLVTGAVAAGSAHLHATLTYACSQADKELGGDVFDALVNAASANATNFLAFAQRAADTMCPRKADAMKNATAPGFLGAAYGNAHGGICETAPQGALLVCVFFTLAACMAVALQIANDRYPTAAAQETEQDLRVRLL